MPLKKGNTQGAISANISELHKGPQYQKTKKKFGRKAADRQAVAIAMDKAKKSPKYY